MNWARIKAFRLVADDLDRLTRFYVELGFALRDRTTIPAAELAMLGLSGEGVRQRLTLGLSRLDLDWFAPGGRAYPADADAASLVFQHLALVTDDAEAAWRRLPQGEISPISRSGPVSLPPENGGVTAVKFRDPDGHPLELLEFPHGAEKGWAGTGMLGIDHSAISIADIRRSREFYSAHGLTHGRSSLNHGAAQVKLDGLDDVQVDVVPMLPRSEPPHVELLGYRNPRPGIDGPRDANDIAATRIVWQAHEAALVRDPDGHLHQLESS